MSLKLEMQWQFQLKYLGFCQVVPKEKKIVKSLLNENNKYLDFDLIYEAEDHLFNENRSLMNDCLKLVGFQGMTHYPGKLQTINCLQKFWKKQGNKSNRQVRCDAISLTHSIMTFSIIISFVIIQYSFLYNQLTDLFEAHKDARNFLSI